MGTDPTLTQEFETAASEPIEATVVGAPPEEWVKPPSGRWVDPTGRPPRRVPDPRLEMLKRVPAGEVVPWGEAREALDFEWDTDYGLHDVPPVVAWSENKVIYVAEHDGATTVTSLPRHPVPFEPAFVRVEPGYEET